MTPVGGARPPRNERALRKLADRLERRAGTLPVAFTLRDADGTAVPVGRGESAFTVVIRNRAALGAARSMSELPIAEAYIRGDLDFEGDLLAAMELRPLLTDRRWLIVLRAHLKPLLVGRRRANPGWIAKHYDAHNMQLLALDREFGVYTPGIYAHDDDTLEDGARRKLAAAFRSLQLTAGDSLLDVGCGWGGFLRYCAQRGIDATGITLSRHQQEYATARLRADGLAATVLYQDFFSYEPGRRFRAISMMGVLEDLSDYRQVMRRLSAWLAPNGRVYLDFASANRRYGIPSLVTKHVWPGKFRMVYLPAFVKAAADEGLDIVELSNDRHNYYLWTKAVHERWVQRRADAVERFGEPAWRLMRLLQTATAKVMSAPSRDTAYRVVLARRSESPFRREHDVTSSQAEPHVSEEPSAERVPASTTTLRGRGAASAHHDDLP